jgi:hypothetical protein
MNKNDSHQKAEALRRALGLRNFNCAPNTLTQRLSNERHAKDATFEERLSFEDKRLLKDMGIAV